MPVHTGGLQWPCQPKTQRQRIHWRNERSWSSMVRKQRAAQSGESGLNFLWESSRFRSRHKLNAWNLPQSAVHFHKQVNPNPTCGITGSVGHQGQAQEFPAVYSSSGERRKNTDKALCQILHATQLLSLWSTKNSRAEKIETGTRRHYLLFCIAV